MVPGPFLTRRFRPRDTQSSHSSAPVETVTPPKVLGKRERRGRGNAALPGAQYGSASGPRQERPRRAQSCNDHRVGRRIAALLVALLGSACTSTGAFVCEADLDCGANGRCEANGHCSFPDASCESGWKFGSLAGGGFAGMCVDPSGTTSTQTTDPDSTSATSSTPTTAGDDTSSESSTSLLLTTASTSTATTTGVDTGTGDTSSSTGGGADGLVIHFAFEEDPELIGGALNSVDNGLDAECGDVCPSAVGGIDGAGVLFGPQNTWLAVPNDPRLNFNEQLTIAVWIRADGAEGDSFDVMVGRPLGPGSLNSYELATTPDGAGTGREIRFNLATLTESDVHRTPSPFEIDNWHHVAGVWDGASTHIYADGALLSSQSVNPPEYDDSDLLIGIDNDNGNFTADWEGAMDELRIYSRALSDEEIAALVRLVP